MARSSGPHPVHVGEGAVSMAEQAQHRQHAIDCTKKRLGNIELPARKDLAQRQEIEEEVHERLRIAADMAAIREDLPIELAGQHPDAVAEIGVESFAAQPGVAEPDGGREPVLFTTVGNDGPAFAKGAIREIDRQARAPKERTDEVWQVVDPLTERFGYVSGHATNSAGTVIRRLIENTCRNGTCSVLYTPTQKGNFVFIVRARNPYAPDLVAQSECTLEVKGWRIDMSPASGDFTAGDPAQQFSAVVKDESGNAVNPQPPIQWSGASCGILSGATGATVHFKPGVATCQGAITASADGESATAAAARARRPPRGCGSS